MNERSHADWPEGTPEAAVIAYLDAVHAERWAVAAALIAHEAGAVFALNRRRFFFERNQTTALTAADYQRLHPSASPEVAAWHAAEHAKAVARRPNEWAEHFAGVQSDAELTSLDVPGLLRSLVEAGDTRYQTRLTYAALGYPIPPQISGSFARTQEIRIVGHVKEAADRVLVVFRDCGEDDAGEVVLGSPEVIEVSREGHGPWRLAPDHQLTLLRHGTVFIYGPDDAPDVIQSPEA